MRKKRICTFGSYKIPGKREKDEMVDLGRLIASKGFEVVTGGFGGTMEYVSKGVKEAGGATIGITYYKRDAIRRCANRFVDKEIKAKNIFERISIMLDTSDGFIILPGGTGTLLELTACLECINKNIMKPKPIILLGDYWEPVIDRLKREPLLSKTARSALNAHYCSELISFASSSSEAIERLIHRLK